MTFHSMYFDKDALIRPAELAEDCWLRHPRALLRYERAGVIKPPRHIGKHKFYDADDHRKLTAYRMEEATQSAATFQQVYARILDSRMFAPIYSRRRRIQQNGQ